MTAQLLLIDDEADAEKAKLVEWVDKTDLRVRYPADLQIDDIEFANVIVVDYRLDEPWTERDNASSIALQPLNGLALCAVIRSHEKNHVNKPTAFLLRSAHLSDLSQEFPPDSRLHIIAAQNNLEWVFSKTGNSDHQMQQVICIDDAIQHLPENWPADNSHASRHLLLAWLKLDGGSAWADLAWQEIEDCHPPLHDLTEHKHGLRLVRWMLHYILPYPCFLWSSLRLASRLRVELESLQNALDGGLEDVFSTARYAGALTDFDGQPRWWGRGIESILWTITDGQSFDSEGTIAMLNERCGNKLIPLPISQPVLCLDSTYRFHGTPCDIKDAVRVQPDDWPAFAEQAWAAIDDVASEPRLKAIVISEDRDQIGLNGDMEESE